MMFYHPVFLILDVSGGEFMLIVLVIFLVFGPDKMPEIARKIGKIMNDMKKASNDLTREFRQETSELRNDLLSAQNKIKEEMEGVNQEVSKTRARVVSDLTISEETPAKTPTIDMIEAKQGNTVPKTPGESEKAV